MLFDRHFSACRELETFKDRYRSKTIAHIL